MVHGGAGGADGGGAAVGGFECGSVRGAGAVVVVVVGRCRVWALRILGRGPGGPPGWLPVLIR